MKNKKSPSKQERKHQRALALVCAIFVFVVLVLTLALAGVLTVALEMLGVRTKLGWLNNDLFNEFLFISIISLVLGIFFSIIAGKYITKPLNYLIGKINMLASGNFKTRMEYGKTLKRMEIFAELTNSFNTMAQELENTEILRSDFINNFSHEFKTPIVSISGFAKLLCVGNLSQQEQREYLEIIEKESRRLAAMATNVLQLSKIESLEILTDVEQYNVSEQLRNCILLLEPKWTKKKVGFDLNLTEQDVLANRELMQQVWINLLDNAIKFSDEDSDIQVEQYLQGNAVCVRISNRGIPIPVQERKKIFGKFYQVDTSHTGEGNGVGLALVDKIVKLHGGSVDVTCEGESTSFTVSLPQF